jgi:MFS family permease
VYAGDWRLRLSQVARQARPSSARRVPANVWALGLTSLLTDVSSEMVVSVLPAYLVLTTGFAPLLLGVATGLHEGGPLLVTWIGGWIADRTGRRKLTAGLGYALSAVCRLGWLVLPAQTMASLAALVLSDRIGKAIRTAPRDALISLSVPQTQLATAFGVHRSLDATGAALGPVLAFLLLWQFPQRFDIIFFTSLTTALLGLTALGLLVEEEKPTPARTGATDPNHIDSARSHHIAAAGELDGPEHRPRLAEAEHAGARLDRTVAAEHRPGAAEKEGTGGRLDRSIAAEHRPGAAEWGRARPHQNSPSPLLMAQGRGGWGVWGSSSALVRVMLLAAVFGVVTISDAFVYVLLIQRSQVNAAWIPLFYTGTAVAFLVLAIPVGAIADLVGRRRVFVLAHGPLLLAYAMLLGGVPGWPWNAVICVVLLGTYYAGSDGVLAGLASSFLPAAGRAMGLAWVDTASSVARLGSSIVFGILWMRFGDVRALSAFTVALVLVVVTVGLLGLFEREVTATT